MANLFPDKYYATSPITDVRTGGISSILSKLPPEDLETRTKGVSAQIRKPAERKTTLFPEKYYQPEVTTQDFFDRLGKVPTTAVESFKMGTYQSMAALAASESNIMDALQLDKIAPKYRERMEKSYSLYRDLMQRQAAKLPPEDPDRPLQEKIKDPLWYARGVSQTLPNIIGAIGVGVTAAVATGGNPFVGGAAAYAYSSMLEGGSAYMEAKRAGATEKDADKVALVVGAVNGALELVPIWKFFGKSPAGQVAKRKLIQALARAAVKQGIEEGVTEGIQEMVSNAATRFYGENTALLNQAVAESAILGFVTGGMFGGAEVTRGVEVGLDVELEGLPEPLREPLRPALAEERVMPPEIMPREEIEPITPEMFTRVQKPPEQVQAEIPMPERALAKKPRTAESILEEAGILAKRTIPMGAKERFALEGTPIGTAMEAARTGGGLFAEPKAPVAKPVVSEPIIESEVIKKYESLPEAEVSPLLKERYDAIPEGSKTFLRATQWMDEAQLKPLDEVRGLIFDERIKEAHGLWKTIPEEGRPDFKTLETEVEIEKTKYMAEAAKEVKDKFGQYGDDIAEFQKILRIAGEKKATVGEGLLYREHIPRKGTRPGSDEVATSMGMTENEFMEMIMPTKTGEGRVAAPKVPKIRQQAVQKVAKRKMQISGGKIPVAPGQELIPGIPRPTRKPPTPPVPPVPESPELSAYQEELLEEIRARPLPEIKAPGAEWRPPTIGYKNPLTKTAYGLWDKLVDSISSHEVLGKLTPRESRSQKAFDLLREKTMVADALYRRSKEDYVRQLEKIDPETKRQIGLMVNKYVPVGQEYAGAVKNIDAEIGRYGDAISTMYEGWLADGWITKEDLLLPKDVFLTNLGQYSRTFYLKPRMGKLRAKPALFTDPNKIDTGMFKKEMTLEDWARAALLHNGQYENSNVGALKSTTVKVANALKKKGIKITDLAAMAEQDLLRVIPVGKVEVGGILFNPQDIARQITNEATKLVENDNVIELEVEELREIGQQAKEDYGWVTQADAMLDKTLKDLVSNYTVMMYFDAIRKDPQMFSGKAQEGFIPVSDLVGGEKGRDVRLGPLNGGHVHPSLQQDLQFIFQYGPENAFNKILGEALSWWKLFKTAGAPATVARNLLCGGLWQTDLAGYPVWNPFNSPKYVKGVGDYRAKNERYGFWRDQGLYGADYHTVEIEQSFLKRIEKASNPMAELGNGLIDKTFKKPLGAKIKEKLSYYGAIDHLARTYLAECALADGATPQQAVAFAHKWQLHYKFVPRFIEALRSGKGSIIGAVMPFASFAYLMAPRILEVLATRPWVLLKYPLIIAAITAFSKSLLGVSDEEEEAQKPEFLSGKSNWTVLLPQRDEKGDIQYLSLDYMLPFGKPTAQNLFTFVDINQMQAMFTGGAPVYQAAVNVVNNYDPFSGEKIYLGDDDPDKWEKIATYFAKQIGPTGLYDIERLWKAFKGEEIGYPLKYPRSKRQAALRAAGIPVYSGGLNVVAGKIRDEEEAIENIEKMMRITLTDDNITEEQRNKKLEKLMSSLSEHVEKIAELSGGFPAQQEPTGEVPVPPAIISPAPPGGEGALFPERFYR